MNGSLKIHETPRGIELGYGGLVLIRHSPDSPFVYVGKGRETISMYHGNFDVQDRIEERLPLETVSWTKEDSGFKLVFSHGVLSLCVHVFVDRQRIVFSLPANLQERNRFWFRFASDPGEKVYGCGEQFSFFNLRGKRFPLWTSEQGVGRNKSSRITFEADVQGKAGGDYWWTFYPQPTFVSSKRYFLHAATSAYAAFDFRSDGFHELEFWSMPERIVISPRETMLEVVSDVSAFLGRQAELPDWIHDGVILGIQGGTETCLKKTRDAIERGVKVTGIWAQDWEGIRITSFGKRLMWNWAWDKELYPGLDAAIREMREKNIRFLGYINPYVAEGKSLFIEADAKGYLARNPQGGVYLVDFGEFHAGIVDFTNGDALEWYKRVIRTNMIDLGLSGWMADFGEYLPTDVVLSDGTSPMLAHNQWPALWAKVNHDAVEEAGVEMETTYFMRAGFTGSQKYCPLMWAGDQNVDWSEDDGLPSVIPAALSLAVSGHGLTHSDIGGYTTLFGMKRDRELFMRWTELAVFSAMMRTHEGNRPGDNWQFDSDDATIAHLARMTRLFTALKDYRKAAVAENADKGTPLIRPLFLHYETEENSWTLKDEFLFGREMLVAPVIAQGSVRRALWLPRDTWIHAWTGKRYQGGQIEVAAPLGEPPVFYRAESEYSFALGEIFRLI